MSNVAINSNEKAWWTREFTKEYLPFVVSNSSLSILEGLLEKYGVYRPNFPPEVTWGFLHPFIRELREAHRRVAPTTLINVLLFTVVTCLVFKAWWRKTGRKCWFPSIFRVRNKSEPSSKASNNRELVDAENREKRETSTCGKSHQYWIFCVDKFKAIYSKAHKTIALWCALVYCKLKEIYQRCKTWWKSRLPSVKKKA